MSYTATKTDVLQQVIAGNTEVLVFAEDPQRVQAIISVTGGDVWIKLHSVADDVRTGIYLKDCTHFELTNSQFVYYGAIYCINAVAGTSPIVHITEIKRE